MAERSSTEAAADQTQQTKVGEDPNQSAPGGSSNAMMGPPSARVPNREMNEELMKQQRQTEKYEKLRQDQMRRLSVLSESWSTAWQQMQKHAQSSASESDIALHGELKKNPSLLSAFISLATLNQLKQDDSPGQMLGHAQPSASKSLIMPAHPMNAHTSPAMTMSKPFIHPAPLDANKRHKLQGHTQPSASVSGMTHKKNPHLKNAVTSPGLLDARDHLSRLGQNNSGSPINSSGQMLEHAQPSASESFNWSAQFRNAVTSLAVRNANLNFEIVNELKRVNFESIPEALQLMRAIEGDVNSGITKTTLPMDHSSLYGQESYGLEHAGITLAEFGGLRLKNKVLSCDFSSDGKLLACGGYDKKVVIWDMATVETESTPEVHKHVISSVCFRPDSTELVTASFDGSVRLWDAADPSCGSRLAYTDHNSSIISLDIHPSNNFLCFGDGRRYIQYWSINPVSHPRVSKGRGELVKFRPTTGHLLAAATGQELSIFDVETDTQICRFEGHGERIYSLCWDPSGDYVVTVSPEFVKVWSMASGDHMCVLSSNGNKFYSCMYHPRNISLLLIGGRGSLEMWDLAQNKTMTLSADAHENIVSALAGSSVTGTVASGSHDSSIKLWK